ncbi:MAG TPA: preQ(1) synthase, partial [Campylobacterales bacterium]|nr:preQ(1) synthase [Campylobacterales bacterium]
MKYGERIVADFDVSKDLEIWANEHKKNYIIKITLPEFTALCPRSGYPDFGEIRIEYTPNEWVVELKAIKLYVNSFRNKHISHENVANEIFDTLYAKLAPKWMKLTFDF